jgi:hypothetical protein
MQAMSNTPIIDKGQTGQVWSLPTHAMAPPLTPRTLGNVHYDWDDGRRAIPRGDVQVSNLEQRFEVLNVEDDEVDPAYEVASGPRDTGRHSRPGAFTEFPYSRNELFQEIGSPRGRTWIGMASTKTATDTKLHRNNLDLQRAPSPIQTNGMTRVKAHTNPHAVKKCHPMRKTSHSILRYHRRISLAMKVQLNPVGLLTGEHLCHANSKSGQRGIPILTKF